MAHTPHRPVILDMDSSESPSGHGQQEGAAYNGHFECVLLHPASFCSTSSGQPVWGLRRSDATTRNVA